jgi:hypothetical protein
MSATNGICFHDHTCRRMCTPHFAPKANRVGRGAIIGTRDSRCGRLKLSVYVDNAPLKRPEESGVCARQARFATASSVCTAVIRPRQSNREIAPRSTEFISESARVDLNAVPKGVLEGRLTAVGVKLSQLASFADRLGSVGERRRPSGQTGEIGAHKRSR